MRLKRIATAAVAIAVVAPVAMAGPVQADAASAQSTYRNIALGALSDLLNGTYGSTATSRAYEPWLSAYTADLVAFRDGSWQSADATAWLVRTVESKNSNGYGMNQDYDAFGDGTTNGPGVAYTVTMADHVGETLIEAYDAGVRSLGSSGYNLTTELQFLADKLWAVPTYRTDSSNANAVGKCASYSTSSNDQPAALNDNRLWCTINVSAGAASTLDKLADRGFIPAGETESVVRDKIADLGAFVNWAQGEGTPSNGGQGATKWPYGFRSVDSTWTDTDKNNPQDANHAAYTAESMRDLGYAGGTNALVQQVSEADHDQNNNADQHDYTTLLSQRSFDIIGRQRAASAVGTGDQRGLLTELQWWLNAGTSVEGKNNHGIAQAGRWAARMAEGLANADSEKHHVVEFMSTPRVHAGNYKGNGTGNPDGTSKPSLTEVKQGSTYTIWTDARLRDGFSNLHFITGVPINLKRGVGSNAPTLLETKTTGFDWYGARFLWTVTQAVGKTVTFCAEVSADQPAPYASNCRTVTVVS